MSDTFGQTSLTPFAQFDHDTRSWKTSQVTSLWALPMSSLTLPKSGGMQNGELIERPMLALPTDESAFSSLPTPHAGLGERGRDGVYPNPKGQQDLQHTLANLLPTPTTQDQRTSPSQDNRKSVPLNRISTLLPTPAVMDMGSNYTPEEWQTWKDKQRAAHNNGNGHGASLTQEALTMLPTPTAQAAKHALDDRGAGTPDDCNLWSVAGRLLPTPRAKEPASTTVGYGKSVLEAVTGQAQNGESTPPPSPDGSLF
jgi:hypothetical protein